MNSKHRTQFPVGICPELWPLGLLSSPQPLRTPQILHLPKPQTEYARRPWTGAVTKAAETTACHTKEPR